MNKELSEKLKQNAILDLSKEELTTDEKGEICKYLQEKNYSLAQISLMLNKPKSTINGWINGKMPYGRSQMTPHKFLVFLKHTKKYDSQDIMILSEIRSKLDEILTK